MRITVIGAGYVGLVTAACFADMGHDVMCVDIDAARVENLEQGIIPIHEPGLEGVIKRNVAAKRLQFTTDVILSVDHGAIQFIAVGTPPAEDGSADLQHVLEAARNIGRYMTEYKVVVDKSTVPIGTADLVDNVIVEELIARNRHLDIFFSVASNPEFLKEGCAVKDFMQPDRVIIGTSCKNALAILKTLYLPFVRDTKGSIIEMDARSAELTKYAANSMLATRISLMNEFAKLADKVEADIELVRIGIGSDSRIGDKFLYPSVGYGGSCFPKDVSALIKIGNDYSCEQTILKAVRNANNLQKHYLVSKIVDRYGWDLSDYTFAVWGLAFKANTDDMRESPAITVVADLLTMGAQVNVYDPKAMQNARTYFIDNVIYCNDKFDALEDTTALLILTEWQEFAEVSPEEIRSFGIESIFDGRNIFDPTEVMDAGMNYFGIGR